MKLDEKIGKILRTYRYPLLILLLGIALMLLPSGRAAAQRHETSDGEEQRLEELLSAVEGVGECRALLSESGVVIVCRGADSAQVRLEILRAVGSYTGFGSDKITILKLAGS